MKACKVTFSVQLLLEQIGLECTDQLTVYLASADMEGGTVTLYLTGDHPALPELKKGEAIPDARIVAKRIESKLWILE